MIFDALNKIECYRGLSANMDRAIDLLLNTDFSDQPAGRYEVDGDRVFYMIQEPMLRDTADAQFEVHHRYIDIQLALTSGEDIRCMPTECVDKWAPFNEASDIGFSDTQEKGFSVPLDAGYFMILYPQDAHMPCLGKAGVQTRKVVVKVAI